ncbi:MAG TPA: DUF1559 domain-containing protein [Pirellulales bacterium]|nr:DUF1559 domain-containing protein [Pirellulales bacterium]
MLVIKLALLNYQSIWRGFPPRSIEDKDGKPLLSWRVAVLPYMEEKNLHRQFHLDEPWDGEHNKALIERIPAAFANPNRPRDGKTNYLLPVGNGTLFGSGKRMRIKEIADASKTIMFVEADEDRAVIWTKPSDLDVDMDHPSCGLGHFRSDGILVEMCDGPVRTLRPGVSETTLKALFNYQGDKAIDPNDY